MATEERTIALETHPGYTLRVHTPDDFFPLWEAHQSAVFGESFSLSQSAVFSAEELAARTRLQENMAGAYRLSLGLYHEDNFVGWSFGWQRDRESYYMTNSAVLPAHQRKGLYTAMLRAKLAILIEEGFQIITSRHRATNNAVLIPKLKAGFVISGLELSDAFGTLVHLQYFTNEKRRVAMDVRCGERKPVGAAAALFDLPAGEDGQD